MLPEVRALLDELEALDGPDLMDLPSAEARQAFEAMRDVFDTPGPQIAQVTDVEANGVLCRLYDPTPNGAEPTYALVFFHGGGFVIGSINSHDNFVRRLAAGLNIPAISVDYRLAPEHPFPAAIDDSVAATRWAATDLARQIGRDVKGLIVCGDSAGGNIAAVIAQEMRGDEGAPIVAQALLYPVADWAGDWPSYVKNGTGLLLEYSAMQAFGRAYIPEGAAKDDPRLSPYRAIDLSGLPPAVVVTAELDVLHDEGAAYADKLREAGVRVRYHSEKGLIHGFYTMPKALPTAARLTDTLIAEIQALL